MLIAQSRYLAEKANILTSEGDSYTARLLSVEALPHDLNNPNRPYVAEADAAIRYAFQNNSAILKGHSEKVNSAIFNHDGNLLVSASNDHTVRIWDVLNGKQLNIIEHSKPVQFAIFSPNGQMIVSASDDTTVRIWNVIDGKLYSCLEHDSNIFYVNFNPTGNKIVTVSYEYIYIYGIRPREDVFTNYIIKSIIIVWLLIVPMEDLSFPCLCFPIRLLFGMRRQENAKGQSIIIVPLTLLHLVLMAVTSLQHHWMEWYEFGMLPLGKKYYHGKQGLIHSLNPMRNIVLMVRVS